MNLNLSIKELQAILVADFIDPDHFFNSNLIQNVVIDSRSPLINKNTLFVVLKGNKTTGARYVQDFMDKGGRMVLTAEQLSESGLAQIQVTDSLRALQKIAAHHRSQFDIPVIGITGSNGKTTVKEWLYHVLKHQFNCVRSPKSYNSQIGVALSVLEMNPTHELAIFEAGISQPGEMIHLEEMIQPTVGVFTGIGDAHNIGFKVEDPETAKKNEKFILFKSVQTLIEQEGDAISIKSDEGAKRIQILTNGRMLYLEDLSGSVSFEMPFSSAAFMQNAGLVYAVTRTFNTENRALSESMKSLPTISMRLEKMVGKHNNLLINDAYNLDEKSLEIGLQYLQNNKEGKRTSVFLAEDPTQVKSSGSLLELVHQMRKQIEIDQVIYFGPYDLDSPDNAISRQYEKVSDFFADPFQIEDSAILFTGARNCHLERVVNYYTEKKHITRLVVDLGNMRENLNVFRRRVQPKTQFLAMVKAQSYGGGMLEVAQFLAQEKVSYFGVAYADEGVTLRKGGIQLPILVMNPEPAAFDDMIDHGLEPSIYTLEVLNTFIHQLILRQKTNYPIHIKLDTGMNRLGFRTEDLRELSQMLSSQPEVFVKSVFSHLSVADNLEEDDYTHQQIENYKDLTDQIERAIGYSFTKHLANSAGAYLHPSAHFDMVRLGIGLFGLMEANGEDEFLSVLSLRSQISQTRIITKGESVGYGRSFKADRQTKIGIVPVGYGDGLRRGLSQRKWSVIIGGKKYPIIGNICMDMCMIDLGDDLVGVGDEVQLFGNGNSIFEMSAALDTIPYEIISSISSRVQRVYTEE